jgi:hypothetical protein
MKKLEWRMPRKVQNPNDEQLLQLSLVILDIRHSFELRHSDFDIPPVAIGGPD